MAKKQEQNGSVFPDLPYFDEDETRRELAEAAEAKKQEKSGPDVTELFAKLEKQEAALADLRRQNLALMTQPPKPAPQAPAGVDTRNLPDPSMEPEKYASELANRFTRAYQSQQTAAERQAQAQAERDAKTNAIWDEFSQKYGEYAKDSRKIKIAAQQVTERARVRGLDPDRYVFHATPMFMEDVTKEYDALFGAPGQKVESGQKPEVKEEDESRTAGIFGGLESGGRPGEGEERETPDDMVAEIRKFQIASGFHR